jgi:hypothetical protein
VAADRSAAELIAATPAINSTLTPFLNSTLTPFLLRDGPERIESGWWDGADVRRDYFVARTAADETVWIYRDHRYGIEDGEWFLHGLFA